MTNDDYKLIIDKYQKLIFTICYQMVNDYQEAENLTQDTFISAYNNINKCNPQQYKAWLARIATNKAKDYLKSAYKRKTQLDSDFKEEAIAYEQQPEQMLINHEKEKLIKEKIKSLKEPYLKVSIMYFIEEKDIDEISTSLNRPKKTIQTQISRAKLILQKIIKEEYSHERAF